MKIVGALVLASATLVAGCGSQTMATPATMVADRGESYRLYTHCGIQWAKIHGTFWRATEAPVGWQRESSAGLGQSLPEGHADLQEPDKRRVQLVGGEGCLQADGSNAAAGDLLIAGLRSVI